ncbi:MAG: translation initiation factor IF-3 [Candidatus Margulisbacteria bacterium]|nr:translation initiation factor IF-3 [Candidatus Margulisiibacteriota bacterium]
MPKNKEIRSDKVRFVDIDNKSQEIMTLADALKKAEEANLDLVAVSPESNPPVCKLLDYSHYIYNQNKLEKKVKKNTKTNIVKELKMSPKISENDYQVRYRATIKFLAKGYKVKVSVLFRGREITHPDLGLSLLKRLSGELQDIAIVEHGPIFNGPMASMVLASAKK